MSKECGEDCIQCGKLTAEGSNLCEGCIDKNEKYQIWSIENRRHVISEDDDY